MLINSAKDRAFGGTAQALHAGAHLVPDPDTLVEVLWEWLPRDEAAHALADTDISILKNNLALADDHQR